jgi:hypothetical protein
MIPTTNLDLFAGIPVADYAAALHGNRLAAKAAEGGATFSPPEVYRTSVNISGYDICSRPPRS